MTMDGPAYAWAALPVNVKMPAPMITPIPKTVRSSQERLFLRANSGSSVSRIDCSIDLVLITDIASPPDGWGEPLARPGLSRCRGSIRATLAPVRWRRSPETRHTGHTTDVRAGPSGPTRTSVVRLPLWLSGGRSGPAP